MTYIYSAHRVKFLDGFYITPSMSDIDNIKEDATLVYTYNEALKEAYESMGVVVNTIDPNIKD
ncbi:MAG: hypothetical protein QG567_2329 [Campylobacterota bacterium]|nr:hypothetical protein [Campylobacterota bacterium]